MLQWIKDYFSYREKIHMEQYMRTHTNTWSLDCERICDRAYITHADKYSLCGCE